MKNLTLRTFDDEDVALLERWLKKDYILKWYHDAEDWLFEVNERNSNFSWLNHFIVMDQETPVGFCQYYDCADANEFDDWYEVTKPAKIYSIDYLIGNEDYLGKGYGKAIIALLVDTIRHSERSAQQIIVQPDKENQPSNHVLLANGFIFDDQKDYYYKLLT